MRRAATLACLFLLFAGLATFHVAADPEQNTPRGTAADQEEALEGSPGLSANRGPTTGSLTRLAGVLQVYFIDMSLGDAIYIRTPSGQDVIIDGGD